MEDNPDILKAKIEEAASSIKNKKAPAKKPRNVSARTYATDIANIMRREKGSIIKIALAEQKRQREYGKKVDPTTTKNLIVIFLGSIFIIGGILLFVYAILDQNKPVPITSTEITLPSFVFTENQSHIDIVNKNRREIIGEIHSKVQNNVLLPNTISNIFVSLGPATVRSQVPTSTFLDKMGIDVPELLRANLFKSFMLGMYSDGVGNDLFLIFKTNDFSESFTGTREWENFLLNEFLDLFDIDVSEYGNDIFSKEFVSLSISNKEARVLKDEGGNIILMYIFLDSHTLLLATDSDSINEITKRLTSQTIR